MATTTLSKIVPHLWFAEKADEAARFYVSLFPESHVDSVTTIPADTPSGPAGSAQVVEFTLAGQQFMAISAGPLDPFNHAISFLVNFARSHQPGGDRPPVGRPVGRRHDRAVRLAEGPLRRLVADLAGRARRDDEGPGPQPRQAP